MKAGRVPVFVWLGGESAAALETLMAQGMSKLEAVEAGLLAIVGGAPKRTSDPDEDDDDDFEEPRPRGDVAVEDGSPASLAERVRARGARRQAVEVATGRVSKDGGRPRQSR